MSIILENLQVNMPLSQISPVATAGKTLRQPMYEWERHKKLITMLYLDLDFTLKQVMEYMKTNHNFNGT